MPSLKFDIGVSTEKLTEELKKANQSFAEFEKSAVQSGQKVDQSFQKSTQNLKEQVAQQKQLIKEIENEIKNASDARDKMARTQDKSNANVELSAMKKSLAEENQKLLNLQSQQIEGNQKEEKSQAGIISSLKDWAIGLATAGAAVKVFKMIAESTESSSQMFEQAVAGMTSGVQYFFKAIASGDWKNFGSGLKTAITGGIEYVTAMERITNLKNEQKVKSANLDIEIGKNWQNVNSTDQAVKVQALKNIKELTKTKLTQEAKLANDVYAIHKTAAAKENGLSEQEIEDVSSNWSKIAEEVEKGEKVIDAFKKVGKGVTSIWGGGLTYSKEEKTAAFNLLKDLGYYNDGIENEATRLEAIAIKYGKVTQKERGALSSEQATGLSATAAIDLEGKRVAMRLAAAQREQAAAAKKLKEDAELDNRIKATQELMKEKALVTSEAGARELAQLAATLAALEREKKKREELLKLVMSPFSATPMKGVTDGVNPSNQGAILSGFVSSISKSTGADTKADQWEIDRAKLKMKLSDEAYQKVQKSEEFQQKEKELKLKKEKQLREDILNAASQLTGVLVQNGILSEEAGNAIGQTLEGFKSLASGDFIGAAMSAISMIMSLIPTEAEKFAAQVDHINQLLKIQQGLIEKSKRMGGEDSALQGQIDLLEKQKALQEERLISAQRKLDKKLFDIGPVYNARVKDVRDLTNSIQDTEIEIAAAKLALTDFLTGGVTENTLADSIAQGFKEGKTSVNDFADYMNTVLLDAVMNIFRADMLKDMEPLMQRVRLALHDKELTPKEKSDLAAEAKAIADKYQSEWTSLTGALDLTGGAAKQTGMVGTMQRSLTEETGTEFVGLARRAADDGRVVRDYTKLGVTHLMKIEANTGETVVQLKRAVVELQSIVSNTKTQYSGKITP